MTEGYRVHLANPSAIQKYTGLKYSDDRHDDFWLAEMLRLDILPEGYIYPKEERPIRDLLGKRSHLVKLRTSLIISLQNIVSRNNGIKLKAGDMKALKTNRVARFFADNEDLALAGKVSNESIDFLTLQIKSIEHVVERKVKLHEPYDLLLDVPGIGKVLALTIMLETGPISRFDKVGNFVSYCRKVSSKWIRKTRRQKVKETRKAVISIWLGPSPRQRRAHGGCTTNPGRITTGRCKKRTP
jgi:transposase